MKSLLFLLPSLGFFALGLFALEILAGAAVAEEDEDAKPGLVAQYRDEHGAVVARIDHSAHCNGTVGSIDPRLAAGPFTARWSGWLESQAPGPYRLHAYVAGQVRLSLAGQEILAGDRDAPGWVSSEPIELPYDWHRLEVHYRAAAGQARLALFWEGPQFQLEPLDPRRLSHDPEETVSGDFERGRTLARALRCTACHSGPADAAPLSGPSLARSAGNLRAPWLDAWLSDEAAADGEARRMPHFALSAEARQAIAAALGAVAVEPQGESAPPGEKVAADGERLVASLGCLACHRVNELGAVGPFGGGDLTRVADKRPAEFFSAWMADPAALNPRHRMPVFELSEQERFAVATYLAGLRGARPSPAKHPKSEQAASWGRRLLEEHQCGACHELPQGLATPKAAAARLDQHARWDAGCLGAPAQGRPGYRLAPHDAADLRDYFSSLPTAQEDAPTGPDGARLLAEHNCLGCHAREGARGLAPRLPAVAAALPDLAPLVPAMTPPPLLSVGDKLHDGALLAAIERRGPPHRPWLAVRMPRFALSPQEQQALVNWLAARDRVPPDAPTPIEPHPPTPEQQAAWALAGARLVTTEGFGCTSCHAIGGVQPVKAPLNALGPELHQLAERIRRPWFDRWVRNPARIVPGMEMPSVQTPVQGVLENNLEAQLAAVWHVLNQPGFRPPEPNPVRVVRRSGTIESRERAIVLTDVLQSGEQVFIKPLLIGLRHRHNLLLDLERNRLADWRLGDVARQRTKGKSWYWELAGAAVLPAEDSRPPRGGDPGMATDLALIRGDQELPPSAQGQFLTEFDALEHARGGIVVRHRLRFAPPGESEQFCRIVQTFTSLADESGSVRQGFSRTLEISGALPSEQFVLRPLPAGTSTGGLDPARPGVISWPGRAEVLVTVCGKPAELQTDDRGVRVLVTTDREGRSTIACRFLTCLPVDRFETPLPLAPAPPPSRLAVIPGYEAIRLPLPDEFMPTALAWRPDGSLTISSLKGNVWIARDSDGDGFEDALAPFGDELAAPYGLAAAGENAVDVITKYALLRLCDDDGDGEVDRTVNLASGWGHTADYHDWAVGLVAGEAGSYYIALPCQQDDRSPAAALWRGVVLELIPRSPTADQPQLFRLSPVSYGHRFPMGLARNREGRLVVTDNQGNYNPFNELNLVTPGAHYGFINRLDQGRPVPPLTPPVIDIPHPWTRSVNGICFLETPPALRASSGKDHFGLFEGHLLGCEYDTRRLVRMSLQTVGDCVQGAVYPFSLATPPEGEPLLGPLVCAVAPDGDVYVGCIRDSGWGGANNLGALTRLRPGELPPGLAEMRAASDGFVLTFTQPLDRERLANPASYSLSSFTRASTPAYGGEDQNRRTEQILAAEPCTDGRQVRLRLAELREGYVYELHLQRLTEGLLHPAEAYFTLRCAPPAEN